MKMYIQIGRYSYGESKRVAKLFGISLHSNLRLSALKLGECPLAFTIVSRCLTRMQS